MSDRASRAWQELWESQQGGSQIHWLCEDDGRQKTRETVEVDIYDPRITMRNREHIFETLDTPDVARAWWSGGDITFYFGKYRVVIGHPYVPGRYKHENFIDRYVFEEPVTLKQGDRLDLIDTDGKITHAKVTQADANDLTVRVMRLYDWAVSGT